MNGAPRGGRGGFRGYESPESPDGSMRERDPPMRDRGGPSGTGGPSGSGEDGENGGIPSWILYLASGAVGCAVGAGIIGSIMINNKQEPDPLSQVLQSRLQERSRSIVGVREDLREDQVCVVCWMNAREIILLPCGHVCLCTDCSVKINDNCPICREQITQKSVAYT